eukprot:gene19709-21655_t
MNGLSFLEKEKTKRKQKKQGSLEEALADLDDIPSLAFQERGCVINATSFGKSFREWIACKYRLDAQIEESSFVCPVCDRNCHSIHVDGHRKTYRFKKVPSSQDTLTQHTAFWNRRKIENLPISLGKQYLKTKQRLTSIKKEKDALMNSVDNSNVRIEDEMIANWEADFREKAKGRCPLTEEDDKEVTKDVELRKGPDVFIQLRQRPDVFIQLRQRPDVLIQLSKTTDDVISAEKWHKYRRNGGKPNCY